MTSPRKPAVYEKNRVLMSVISNRFYFCSRVRVLEGGLRKVVGRKMDVTRDLQPYLRREFMFAEPGTRSMGTIERELRNDHREVRSGAAHRVWLGASAELLRQGRKEFDREDIASEAIEAAEALGL